MYVAPSQWHFEHDASKQQINKIFGQRLKGLTLWTYVLVKTLLSYNAPINMLLSNAQLSYVKGLCLISGCSIRAYY